MYKCGTIILVPFPFTDLTSIKLRPALIISRNHQSPDIIVSFITTQKASITTSGIIKSNTKTGLKINSYVRFDKIATLDKKIILGELGKVDDDFFIKNKEKFFALFGF